MKRVLVTGATGFIGQYVVQQLINRGCYVIVAVRDINRVRQIWENENLQYVLFDLEHINSNENYYDYFHRPDTLIHLAWEGLPYFKSDFHIQVNLPRHISFLHNLIRNGLRNLVVTGTCLEYGMQQGEMTEDLPVEPIVAYAIAKHQLHESLKSFSEQYSVKLKWLRLFYMWGERQNEGSLIPQLNKAIRENKSTFPMSGGEQVRDFLPVETMADYIVQFALDDKVSGCFNCCSGIPISVKEFVEMYVKKTGSSIQLELGVYPYPDYEPMSFWGSTNKLNTIIHTNESGRTIF